jgi:hypothetical protein
MHCIVDLGSPPRQEPQPPKRPQRVAPRWGRFFAQPAKRDSNFGRSDLSWHQCSEVLKNREVLNGARKAKDILGANGVLDDVDDRDGLNRASGSSDLRSGLSGLPARIRLGGQLLRLQLHVAGSVQRVGVGSRRPVRHQSIFCERATARRPKLPPRLLNIVK